MTEQEIRSKYLIPKDFSLYYPLKDNRIGFCWISSLGFIRRIIEVNLEKDEAMITFVGGRGKPEIWNG